MDAAVRAEILRRYTARAHCFDRYAATRRRLGLSVPEPELEGEEQRAVVPADGMTAVELCVLHLIAHGLTDRQIGERVGISEYTVKAHARSLFRKLEARNRPHAVAKAIKRGLLTLELLAERQN